MKPYGVTRKLDRLGRITLPIALRRRFDMDKHEDVEIFVDEDRIILEKYDPTLIPCQVTGKESNTNKLLAHGNIVLSEEGARELLKELANTLNLD